MITISRTKYGIRFHDVIFATNPREHTQESHLTHFSQALQPLDGFVPCRTRIVDLAVDNGVLFASLSSNTRYKIRRAEREGISPFFNSTPSVSDLEVFCSYFNTFARAKCLPLSNRNKLLGLCNASSLILAGVHDTQGELLVMHAYMADRDIERIRLLYSASHFRSITDTEERNRIGRANRFLHWYEMSTGRSHGYRHYDLGGIPVDDTDEEKNAIARFKSEFGGSTVTEYNGFASRHRFVRQSLPAIQRIFA
jgi:hypothetical protein